MLACPVSSAHPRSRYFQSVSSLISLYIFLKILLSIEIYSSQKGLRHTYSALFDFFRNDGENVENFNHYCRNRVHHSLIWRHVSVCVQTSKKCFYALEYLRKHLLVGANVLGCLRIVRITMDCTKVQRRVRTERSTENPINITFAGNTCQINMRVDLGKDVLKHTELAPSLSVSEKA